MVRSIQYLFMIDLLLTIGNDIDSINISYYGFDIILSCYMFYVTITSEFSQVPLVLFNSTVHFWFLGSTL